MKKMDIKSTVDRKPAGSSTFAIGEVPCSADGLVAIECAVLSNNYCSEKPVHRQYSNRYRKLEAASGLHTYENLNELNFVRTQTLQQETNCQK